MQYQKIRPAIFFSRPNRFVAQVELEGEQVTCHVKNTGRCGSCWFPARLYTYQRVKIPTERQNMT